MTPVDIANKALNNLGQTQTIGSFVENSTAAGLCNRYYNDIREELLKNFPWNFAVKVADLTVVTDETDDVYSYVYEYPEDCLRVLRVGVEGDGNEPTANPFDEHMNSENPPLKRIYCDLEDARAKYVFDVQEVDQMPSEFRTALAWELSNRIAAGLASSAQMMQMAEVRAQKSLAYAKQLCAMERRLPQQTANRYIDARR